MDYVIVCTVTVFIAALTLFSGFGLGTLLMPVFALFFPVPVAVAATAVVHLANNIFKVALIGRKAHLPTVKRFALPAAVAAMVGAGLLTLVGQLSIIAEYSLGGQEHQITAVKVVIGFLIVVFALFDLLPQLTRVTFDARYLPIGGLLSGFFGGLSGHQGAMRSAFLIKAGLDKEAFVGTGVVSAVIVDAARLLVYGAAFYAVRLEQVGAGSSGLIAAATLAAFLGSFLGKRLLRKVTLRAVQVIVGVLLILLGFGLAAGLV